ncbi:MAG TPA: hypothetical protein VEC16_00940 [Alphaproteobacteria bacterium]|nr:hypothetical protein [Alphaproteobacteria bacterium]
MINLKLKKSSKGQSSMEFVILTGFMLIAFLVFYIVIQSKLVEANRDSTDIAAKQVETMIINELKIAESVTDGYYREFILPPKINGMPYNVSIIPGVGGTPEIVIKYSNKERVYFVLQGYIDSSSTVGIGKNSISKNNGIILMTYDP